MSDPIGGRLVLLVAVASMTLLAVGAIVLAVALR
jgi:hypothetical protein